MSTPTNVLNTPLAVIILNWNAAHDTLACLTHITQWQGIAPRIWVVDNASSTADLTALRAGIATLPLDCTLLENATNLGFAGGTNRGLTAALAVGDAPVLLLNNDARIDAAHIQQLLATFAAHPHIGWLGPVLYHGDRLNSVGRRNPVLHHNSLITELPATPLFEVDFISGSVALVRAELVRQIGLLDEDYFFNTEVADHCHRARDAGYQTVVDCRARADHNLDRSSALRNTLYVYYIIRNRFVYVHKRYRAARLPLLAFWMLYCVLLSAKLRLTGSQPTATAVWLGMVDGITHRWGGQNARILAACGQPAPATPAADHAPTDEPARASRL